MKIFFLLTEYSPIIAHGDLSEITYKIIKNISNNGIEIEIFMPLYRNIISSKKKLEPLVLKDKTNYKIIKNNKVEYFFDYYDNIKVNFVKNSFYFTNRSNIYGYKDDTYRFSFFSLCLLEYLKNIEDKVIVHIFDWHFCILPLLLKNNSINIPVILNMNNINYQGITDVEILDFLKLDKNKYFNYKELEFFGKVNLLKAGLIYSYKIIFYSEVYKNSLMQSNYLSKGLSELLFSLKNKIKCISLGIDDIFNPETDDLIYKKYSVDNLLDKIFCKIELQKSLNLPIHTEIPIIVIPSIYMTDDEIILINSIIPYTMRMEIQIIIIGNKLSDFENNINKLSLGINCSIISVDFNIENLRKVFSGSDIFLDISPTGSNEYLLKIALKYGLIPIVLKEYDYLNIGDNRFRIFNFTTEDLINTIKYTINKYYYFSKWNEMVKNVMKLDYSWLNTTSSYMNLYKSIYDKVYN